MSAINHSADFGHGWLVRVEYDTDELGRPFNYDDPFGDAPYTLHGPFLTYEDAVRWMETYPDSTDVVEVSLVVFNLVRPANNRPVVRSHAGVTK